MNKFATLTFTIKSKLDKNLDKIYFLTNMKIRNFVILTALKVLIQNELFQALDVFLYLNVFVSILYTD